MRIAGKDEASHAHFPIGLDLGQDLVGRTDQRRAASRSRTANAGPQRWLDEAFHIGQIAVAGLTRHAK